MSEPVLLLRDPSSAIAVELTGSAPRAQCRLKLWNERGRRPFELEEFRFDARGEHAWPLAPVVELGGHTLTWTLRLAKTDLARPARFEIRLRVIDGRAPLAGGDFLYTGPLDDAFEERSGRFHFKKAGG